MRVRIDETGSGIRRESKHNKENSSNPPTPTHGQSSHGNHSTHSSHSSHSHSHTSKSASPSTSAPDKSSPSLHRKSSQKKMDISIATGNRTKKKSETSMSPSTSPRQTSESSTTSLLSPRTRTSSDHRVPSISPKTSAKPSLRPPNRSSSLSSSSSQKISPVPPIPVPASVVVKKLVTPVSGTTNFQYVPHIFEVQSEGKQDEDQQKLNSLKLDYLNFLLLNSCDPLMIHCYEKMFRDAFFSSEKIDFSKVATSNQ